MAGEPLANFEPFDNSSKAAVKERCSAGRYGDPVLAPEMKSAR